VGCPQFITGQFYGGQPAIDKMLAVQGKCTSIKLDGQDITLEVSRIITRKSADH